LDINICSFLTGRREEIRRKTLFRYPKTHRSILEGIVQGMMNEKLR
jgi:hypothetical protein